MRRTDRQHARQPVQAPPAHDILMPFFAAQVGGWRGGWRGEGGEGGGGEARRGGGGGDAAGAGVGDGGGAGGGI